MERDVSYTTSTAPECLNKSIPELVWTCKMEEPQLGIKTEGKGLSMKGSIKEAKKKMEDRLKLPGKRLSSNIVEKGKVFVSHCHADKQKVDALIQSLDRCGVNTWYDSREILAGLSLREQIVEGLRESQAGILYITNSFLAGRKWTQRELNALMNMQENGKDLLFVVVDGVTHDQLKAYDPILSDLVYLRASDGLDHVASEIVRTLEAIHKMKTPDNSI